MSRQSRLTFAFALVLGSLMAFGPTHAQQAAPAGGGPKAAAGGAPKTGAQQPGAQPPGEGEEGAEAAERFPVFAVTSVEVLHSRTQPEVSVIVVGGLTSADGWTDGELVPLEAGTPPDGVLDLVFVAEAPEESAEPTGYAPMHAILPLPAGHPFKGVRVRSATNSVVLHDLNGLAQAKPPVEPCSDCVGRPFVEKGATAPAGTDAAQVVRADALPPHTRVIHANEGIPDMQRDPDRLTILIGEDGRILDAAWE